MGDFSALPGTAIVSAAPVGSGRDRRDAGCPRVAGGLHLLRQRNARQPNSPGGDVTAEQLDITDAAGVRQVVDTFAQTGGVHTVVHAAGAHAPMRHLSTVETDRFDQQLGTDTGGFFNVVAAVLPHLRRSRGRSGGGDDARRRGASPFATDCPSPQSRHRGTDPRYRGGGGPIRGARQLRRPGMLLDGNAERLIADGDLDEKALDAAAATPRWAASAPVPMSRRRCAFSPHRGPGSSPAKSWT